MNPLVIAKVVFEEGWNRQEFTNVRRILADELPLHIGRATRITNPDEFETIVGAWHTAFPNLQFAVHSITADDHFAAVRATLHGTHEGPWRELEPTG